MAMGKEARAKLKEEARNRARLRSMEKKQEKKTAVSGTMKGPQVDTTISPYKKPSPFKKAEREQSVFKKVKDVPYTPAPKISQDAKLNESNAPNPFRPKKVEETTPTKKEMTMMEKAKDIIGVGREATEKEKMGRALQDNARKSMGMKKGGKVYCKDGCAVRGKTKGKLY